MGIPVPVFKNVAVNCSYINLFMNELDLST